MSYSLDMHHSILFSLFFHIHVYILFLAIYFRQKLLVNPYSFLLSYHIIDLTALQVLKQKGIFSDFFSSFIIILVSKSLLLPVRHHLFLDQSPNQDNPLLMLGLLYSNV